MKKENTFLGLNINQIRQILIEEYSDLCFILNESIHEDEKIVVSPQRIKSQMDGLRTCIAILASTYMEGNCDFQAIELHELPSLNSIDN